MLQTKTVRPELLTTLRELMNIPVLSDFYLVGGTGLSLIYGHRSSIDIDLFTFKDFDPSILESILSEKYRNGLRITGSSQIFLFTYINEVKVDLVNNKTLLSYPINIEDGIRIANSLDIATLKLKAIFQRGSKKDFVDLYQLLHEYSVEELINAFQIMFPNIDIGQLLMSMQYFGDAEEFEMPPLFIKADWQKIKKFIADAVIKFIKA